MSHSTAQVSFLSGTCGFYFQKYPRRENNNNIKKKEGDTVEKESMLINTSANDTYHHCNHCYHNWLRDNTYTDSRTQSQPGCALQRSSRRATVYTGVTLHRRRGRGRERGLEGGRGIRRMKGKKTEVVGKEEDGRERERDGVSRKGSCNVRGQVGRKVRERRSGRGGRGVEGRGKRVMQ